MHTVTPLLLLAALAPQAIRPPPLFPPLSPAPMTRHHAAATRCRSLEARGDAPLPRARAQAGGAISPPPIGGRGGAGSSQRGPRDRRGAAQQRLPSVGGGRVGVTDDFLPPPPLSAPLVPRLRATRPHAVRGKEEGDWRGTRGPGLRRGRGASDVRAGLRHGAASLPPPAPSHCHPDAIV